MLNGRCSPLNNAINWVISCPPSIKYQLDLNAIFIARKLGLSYHPCSCLLFVDAVCVLDSHVLQVLSHKLLDAEFSHPALRAFFIPYFSSRFVRFGRFNLYRRAKISN